MEATARTRKHAPFRVAHNGAAQHTGEEERHARVQDVGADLAAQGDTLSSTHGNERKNANAPRNELAPFTSSHRTGNSISELNRFGSASAHHAVVCSTDQSGKTYICA
jgi:hypothetical protein